jgi:hypothetical protein
MTRTSSIAVLWFVLGLQPALTLPARSERSQDKGTFEIITTAEDVETGRALRPTLLGGVRRIERFLGAPFPKPFIVEILPSRAAFDERLNRELGGEAPQRWMVAMGLSGGVVLLSPRLWKTDADEHDGSDRDHVRDILLHELVHVHHAQRNPSRDFEGMDDLGWFVEGLAVYASGQLTGSHRTAAAKAIAEGKAPVSLAAAWSGKFRYGVCGSMVEYIDKRFGRKALIGLLGATRPVTALNQLRVTEAGFLSDWKRWASRSSESQHDKGPTPESYFP